VERKGRVVAVATADAKAETMMGMVTEYILPDSIVYIDEWISYDGLAQLKDGEKKPMAYQHRRINHSAGV
jgi:transposase-like protein